MTSPIMKNYQGLSTGSGNQNKLLSSYQCPNMKNLDDPGREEWREEKVKKRICNSNMKSDLVLSVRLYTLHVNYMHLSDALFYLIWFSFTHFLRQFVFLIFIGNENWFRLALSFSGKKKCSEHMAFQMN